MPSARRWPLYGNLVTGTTPDNSAGNLDHGWLGQHERPIEHESTLQAVIEMGTLSELEPAREQVRGHHSSYSCTATTCCL